MGFMDKLKKSTTGEENYDEMYGTDIYDGYGYDAYSPEGTDEADNSAYAYAPVDNTATQAYSTAATGGISIGGAALEMKVVKPEHFESVPQIADHLLNKRTVVLNLENTNKETARRLIDFLSGVAYSIDGSLKKIASNAYVITPNNVDVGDAQLKSGSARREAEEAPAEAAPAATVADQFGDF